MQADNPLKHHHFGDLDQPNLPGNGGGTVLEFEGEFLFESAHRPRVSGSGAAGGSGGSGAGGGTTQTGGGASGSPFVINISWDDSVSSAPPGFVSAVESAVQYLESQFVNPATVTIAVGYGEVMGFPMGGGVLGESAAYLDSVSYSTLASALAAHATTAFDQSAVATLPASSPVSNGSYWVTTAEEKALGLASGSSIDGYVGFSSLYGFTYDDSAGVASGTYDFNGTVLHELTEVMGRLVKDGGSIGNFVNNYYPLDLYHYSAAGTRDFTQGTPGYLSADSGVTNSGNLNTDPGGDPGDWDSSMGNDSFNAFSYPGVVNGISADDLSTMNLLGWEPAAAAPPPPPPPPPPGPSGVTVAASTQSLS
ncbi:MAG TPA: NF038122 family metalloprotease, partial [Mycobacterium sp.]|nr:NF038122 family metalloprotease [Mycobacterium sp.]